MSPPPKKIYDRWRDDQGTHIPVGCRVEQTHIEAQYGALRSRLNKQAIVISHGRGHRGNRLYVQFNGENQQVSIRPHLVRVVTTEAGTSPPSVEHVIKQLRDLLLPAPDGDDHAR